MGRQAAWRLLVWASVLSCGMLRSAPAEGAIDDYLGKEVGSIKLPVDVTSVAPCPGPTSLPAAVSKNHLPSFLMMGTGKGQKFSPTSSTDLASDSRTIRLDWLRAVVNSLKSLVA